MNQWIPLFQNKIFEILTKDYEFSISEALDALENYKSVFELLDKNTEPRHVASRIKSDKEMGYPSSYYIESLTVIQDASTMLANHMKMPNTKNREHEFCVKCNYPKYKDEECRFCK
jgi:hypothetical protein